MQEATQERELLDFKDLKSGDYVLLIFGQETRILFFRDEETTLSIFNFDFDCNGVQSLKALIKSASGLNLSEFLMYGIWVFKESFFETDLVLLKKVIKNQKTVPEMVAVYAVS